MRRRLLAFGTAFTTIGTAGFLGFGVAAADDTKPVDPAPGGAHAEAPSMGTPGRG